MSGWQSALKIGENVMFSAVQKIPDGIVFGGTIGALGGIPGRTLTFKENLKLRPGNLKGFLCKINLNGDGIACQRVFDDPIIKVDELAYDGKKILMAGLKRLAPIGFEEAVLMPVIYEFDSELNLLSSFNVEFPAGIDHFQSWEFLKFYGFSSDSSGNIWSSLKISALHNKESLADYIGGFTVERPLILLKENEKWVTSVLGGLDPSRFSGKITSLNADSAIFVGNWVQVNAKGDVALSNKVFAEIITRDVMVKFLSANSQGDQSIDGSSKDPEEKSPCWKFELSSPRNPFRDQHWKGDIVGFELNDAVLDPYGGILVFGNLQQRIRFQNQPNLVVNPYLLRLKMSGEYDWDLDLASYICDPPGAVSGCPLLLVHSADGSYLIAYTEYSGPKCSKINIDQNGSVKLVWKIDMPFQHFSISSGPDSELYVAGVDGQFAKIDSNGGLNP